MCVFLDLDPPRGGGGAENPPKGADPTLRPKASGLFGKINGRIWHFLAWVDGVIDLGGRGQSCLNDLNDLFVQKPSVFFRMKVAPIVFLERTHRVQNDMVHMSLHSSVAFDSASFPLPQQVASYAMMQIAVLRQLSPEQFPL